MLLSVVICTYNPKKEILNKVFHSLQQQTFDQNNWELILVDNNSTIQLSNEIDLSWHPNAKICIENKAGLAHARLRGVNEAKTGLIVFVDDDNLLDENYLKIAYEFHLSNTQVGCYGGKSLPVFDTVPPDWFFKTGINLGCQDFGDDLYISNFKLANFKLADYPKFAPIGTGMVITKTAFLSYNKEVSNNPIRLSLGRKGKSLSSGEDNDIIISIVKNGYEIAYLPNLMVKHLIPANRYSKKYIENMAYESSRSWVKVMNVHDMNPWKAISPLTIHFRQYKLYFTLKAWKSIENYVSWKVACGIIKGRSEIN